MTLVAHIEENGNPTIQVFERRNFRLKSGLVIPEARLGFCVYGPTKAPVIYPSSETAEARFKGEETCFIYSRYANPTIAMFESRMCALEGAEESRATASGMAAAAAALLCQVKAGDHVVAARSLFGSCRWIIETLLPSYGVETTLVDGGDPQKWEEATRPNTNVFFLETPTNPTLDVIDIVKVAEIAHAIGAKLIVDNVFATPLLQKPLDLGADVVVYSATKHIDGQGRCLGGVVLSDKDWMDARLHDYGTRDPACRLLTLGLC